MSVTQKKCRLVAQEARILVESASMSQSFSVLVMFERFSHLCIIHVWAQKPSISHLLVAVLLPWATGDHMACIDR